MKAGIAFTTPGKSCGNAGYGMVEPRESGTQARFLSAIADELHAPSFPRGKLVYFIAEHLLF